MQTVIQLSDLHCFANAKKSYNNRLPYAQLSKAIEHAQQCFSGEKIFVVTGDLAEEATPETYRLLSDLFNQLASPVYIIAGNHDNDAMLKQHITGKNIQHDGEMYFNHWALLFLNSSTPGKNLGSGRLPEIELARLEKSLRENSSKDIMIFIHHPPILIGKKSFQQICLENKNEFDEIIQHYKNIKAIAFGHAHTQLATFIENRLYISSPSTWLQVDHSTDEKGAYTNQPGGYNWYNLGEMGFFQWGTNYF
jgi:Icc protein